MAHDLVIQLTVKDVANLIRQESPTYTAKGLPWALRVVMECSDRTDNENKLAIYVKCNWESENQEWNCDYSASYTLVNRDADASFSKSILNRVLNFHHSFRGFHSFVKLTHLINEEKGFVTDGSITIEVKITINKITGVDKVTLVDFSKPIENTNNVVLVIDQKRLNVSKDLLSIHSSVFTALFFSGFSEKEKEEIELKEIDYDAVRVGQCLAQLKNLDSLKLCEWGFSRVLMTMDIFISHFDLPLAPDAMTSTTVFRDLFSLKKS